MKTNGSAARDAEQESAARWGVDPAQVNAPASRRTPAAPTLEDAFEAMAFSEISETCSLHGTVPAIAAAVEALTAHLEPVDRTLWWSEFKHCVDRRRAVAEGNGAWHDEGIDWDGRVGEALGVLTGVRAPHG